MNPPVSRTRIWTCRLAALTIFVVVGYVFWMAIDRDKPFIRVIGQIEPAKPKAEDWITAIWQTKPLRRDCRPVGPRALSRTIIDGAGKVVDIAPVEAVYDGSKQIVRSFQLPAGVTPGQSRYRASACFACGMNPSHYIFPICVDQPEIEFEIGRPEPVVGERGERGVQGERGERGSPGGESSAKHGE